MIKILLDIARTLARQCLAFRGDNKDENGNFTPFVNLTARYFPVLLLWFADKNKRLYHATYCTSESQNEVSAEVQRIVVDEVKTA